MQSEQQPTQVTPFETIGGEAKVRALVDRFYDLMDLEPKYAELRLAHGTELERARQIKSREAFVHRGNALLRCAERQDPRVRRPLAEIGNVVRISDRTADIAGGRGRLCASAGDWNAFHQTIILRLPWVQDLSQS